MSGSNSGETTLHEAATPAAPHAPFAALAASLPRQEAARARITALCRIAEADAVRPLLAEAALAPEQANERDALARRLVEALRRKAGRGGGIEGLIREYDLSSGEGVALMCLAEALLRIPDTATRDALIRDKIGAGDWQAHVGRSPSLFVNAATWGLVVTGRLTATGSERGLGAALTALIARGGEPLIRRGVDLAMRLMGEQFVCGQTIEAALAASRRLERRGFRYSYDMLGEAALTAEDAARYLASYEHAIHAIGRAAAGRGLHDAPGISIKLSALHPRYGRAQRGRMMAELLPRLVSLAGLARGYGIGLNIDAEEADRLELSLDLLEALCLEPALAGWDGIGFVVQAYGKRAPAVIDWIIALARRSGHRIMLRLVKGAYWDSEIKRAQQEGLADFPVFTRKAHTDLSYLACARRLLGATDAVFAQFATHNAATLASIMTMAGPGFRVGDYEFQCLHGMGEQLYDEVVGAARLDRPCRIYAPVGSHETLLAYLVRRLLENGANTSFVNRVADADVPVEALIADPVGVVTAQTPPGAPHPRIALPRDLYADRDAGRANAWGLDLASEQMLAGLAPALAAAGAAPGAAGPPGDSDAACARPVRSPAGGGDIVGEVREIAPEAVAALAARAAAGGEGWAGLGGAGRTAILCRAADRLEAAIPRFIALIVREGGRTIPDALSEVREAVDFLRYYALAGEAFTAATHTPLGLVACISPWNFPLAIFVGQVAAALAAGNAVLAKPAEETPLVAAAAVGLLHEAGVPASALMLVPGDGAVGAALVACPEVGGVMFTGSTEAARSIGRTLAVRLRPDGQPVVLVAETGGLNAMVVDSSALPEQVVGDVIQSAFNSAGQRCSALRLLCLQEEAAPRILEMLDGAAAELAVGPPDRLETDIGPVIGAEARQRLADHVTAMRARGFAVRASQLPPGLPPDGHYVAPAVIEIGRVADLPGEVFGPVLHVLRYKRAGLDRLLGELAATGYALTFGVHSRIDETIDHLAACAPAGNIYVNRNMIGAVVGTQPFGGHGLSGTGPKAGGPLLLDRLLARAPAQSLAPAAEPPAAALRLAGFLREQGETALGGRVAAIARRAPGGAELLLPGPVGERNSYRLLPRGWVLCRPATPLGLAVQLACVLATGNRAVLDDAAPAEGWLSRLPDDLRALCLPRAAGAGPAGGVASGPGAAREEASCALFEGDPADLRAFAGALAAADGPLRPVFALSSADLAAGLDYPTAGLLRECSVSVNTAAAGGNASLMSIG